MKPGSAGIVPRKAPIIWSVCIVQMVEGFTWVPDGVVGDEIDCDYKVVCVCLRDGRFHAFLFHRSIGPPSYSRVGPAVVRRRALTGDS